MDENWGLGISHAASIISRVAFWRKCDVKSANGTVFQKVRLHTAKEEEEKKLLIYAFQDPFFGTKIHFQLCHILSTSTPVVDS